MTNRGFDEQIAALDALKGRPLEPADVAFLRKSLANRNNFLVARAARLAEENCLLELLPEMLAAFDRFFENGAKTDPQCWAKNAISRALPRFECRDKQVYLRGLHYRQMEPTWGGRSDTAGTVRANCAHALLACDGIDNQELLILLLDLLVDQDKSVRVEAVRAIGQLGEIAVPLLRLRALVPLVPAEEPEVFAACFNALLAIERENGVPFAARILESGDERASEAAFALAETRLQPALDALLRIHRHPAPATSEPAFVEALLSAIALTRLPAAADYLIGLIRQEDRSASAAIEALARTAPNEELRLRVAAAVDETGSPRLLKQFHENFPAEGN